MNRLLRRAALACLMALPLLSASQPAAADRPIVAALRRAAPDLSNAVIVRRIRVDGRQDLVVALASPQPEGVTPDGRYRWSLKDRLGLFLQSRSETDRVSPLAIEAGPNDDCSTTIERITTRELVLSCIGEKWSTYDNRTFVYDIRAKTLLSYFSYPPFRTAQALRNRGGLHFVMTNGQQLLLVDVDASTGALRVAPAAEASRVLPQIPMMEETSAGGRVFRTPAPPADPVGAFGPGQQFRLSRQKNKYGSEYTLIVEGTGPNRKSYPLAQSDLRTWEQARPDDVKSFLRPSDAEMNEEIGPHQLEGGRLWFGKTFYDSEGATGVGGFGYFDATARAYRIYSPPEIQRWSVSAILVEADCVWLALYRRGEFGNSPGGLLRWDRQTGRVRSFAVRDIVTSMARGRDVIYLGATDGIVVLRGDRIGSYFVNRGADGQHMMATASH